MLGMSANCEPSAGRGPEIGDEELDSEQTLLGLPQHRKRPTLLTYAFHTSIR